ncbi:MAG: zinc-binding dehydrogenase [Armatimonadetes bacterium]|nr:zinc-binding dehydrogenase [Armatimonadota bacterium]
MKAAVVAEPQTLRVEAVPLPKPGPGQIRIQLEGCGVCASNIPPWEGRDWYEYPFPPGQMGHEGWGTVDTVGPEVQGFTEGDRVAFLSNRSYAEYDLCEAGKAVKIPQSLSGRPFPGEPLGCAMNIFKRSEIASGQTVVILGIGFLGALLTQLCKSAGARVIAISRRPFSLDIARRMGADETVEMGERWDVINRVAELTGGVGGYGEIQGWPERVIECTGKQEGLDLVGEITAVRGRAVIAGFHQDGHRTVDMQYWNWRGIDVINAHERDPQVNIDGIRAAVKAVEHGQLDPFPLYTHTLPLERLDEALNMTRERPDGFMKALISLE